MRKVLTSARRYWPLRSATALAAVGVLILTSGVAVLATPATATQGEEHKIWVCHATSSDSNPYVAIHVDEASVKYQGHLAHRTDPNKRWKEVGTWNSVDHAKNQDKPDLIQGIDFTDPAYCGESTQPPTIEQPQRGTDQSCALGHGVRDGIRYIEFEWVDGDETTDSEGGWEQESESEQEVVWGEWQYTPYSAEEYARLCETRPPTKDSITVPLTQSQSSCERGLEQRSGSQTTSYTWNARTEAFDASEGMPVWGSWTFVRGLTDAEFEALGCRPDQPQPLVVDLVDEQMGCDIGVEGRAGTQTTSYVWDVGSREYDAVVGPEVWGDWAKVRDLTTEEFLGLDCVLGEETVIPKPETDKPGSEPTIAGVQTVAPQANVPTAVAAGLAGDAGVSAGQLLGQVLVGLGLAMMLTAGGVVLRRSPSGAHQS